MGLEYPDVLVSTLSSVLSQFSEQICANESPRESAFFGRLFVHRTISKSEEVANELALAVASLEELKRAPSESEIEWTSSYVSEDSQSRRRVRAIGSGHKSLTGSIGSDNLALIPSEVRLRRVAEIPGNKGGSLRESHSRLPRTNAARLSQSLLMHSLYWMTSIGSLRRINLE